MVIFPLVGSHILLTLSTYIIGETPFPEYSVVVVLDDIPLAYYDSNVNKLMYRNYQSDQEEKEQEDAAFVFQWIYKDLKKKARAATDKIDGMYWL